MILNLQVLTVKQSQTAIAIMLKIMYLNHISHILWICKKKLHRKLKIENKKKIIETYASISEFITS